MGGARVILASHCGRPKGQVNEKMRMTPMANRLSELISKTVATVDDCVGSSVSSSVSKLSDGDVLMLENARFHKEEEKMSRSSQKTWPRAPLHLFTSMMPSVQHIERTHLLKVQLDISPLKLLDFLWKKN